MEKKKNLSYALLLTGALALVITVAFAVQFWILPQQSITELLPEHAQAESVGEQAPDFEFLGEQGHALKLSDFAGTPIVLNFWASWCPPCRMEKPHFQRAFEQYGDDVAFIVLNVDEPMDTVRAYMDEEGFTFPVYFDVLHEGSEAFGVTGVPETVFIDADGFITSRFLGAINFDTIEHALEEILE